MTRESARSRIRLGFILGSIAWSWGSAASALLASEPRVVSVSRGEIRQDVTLPGILVSASVTDVIAPDVPGLSRLNVISVAEEGQRVKSGEILVVFDAQIIQERVMKAQEQLAVARAGLALREREFEAERIERVLEVKRRQLELKRADLLAVKGVGLVPALQLEKAELDRQAARLRLNQTRQEMCAFDKRVSAALQVDRQKVQQATQLLQLHLTDLREMVLTAAEPGVVEKFPVRVRGGRARLEAGHQVRPGERLLRLIEPAQLQARLCSRTEPADDMVTGKQVYLVVNGLPGSTCKAAISSLEPGCQEPTDGTSRKRGWTLVLQIDPPPERWWPGQRVTGTISVLVANSVLRLPAEAVASRDGQAYVHLVDAGGPVSRPVTTGKSAGGWVEITQGLKEGDRVILQR